MRKIILSSIILFISAFAFGQSVTILPTQTTNSSNSSLDNIVLKSNVVTNGIYGYLHNGTLASPTAVTSGQELFKINGGGSYLGSNFNAGGSLRFTATDNWSGTSTGTKISLWTVQNGTVGLSQRMTINHDGKVGIGIADPQDNLHVHNPNAASTGFIRLSHGDAGNTTSDGLELSLFSAPDLFSLGARIMNKENASLYLGTNNSTIMNLSPNGNVGINSIFLAPATGRFQVTHNTSNVNTYPHINLKTSNNASNGMIRMENLDGSRFFGQYFNVGSATPANNFISFDYNGTQPILDLAGNGNAQIAGFTKLGGTAAPAIKMKKLTGTTAVAQGGNVSIVHGIADPSKILSIQVLVRYNGSNTDAWVGNGYTGTGGYEFSYQYDGGLIYILNTSGNSANILSKDIKIVVTYEE